jgi:hypothetical protein
MDRTDAIAWVLSVCLGLLRKSQAKTLSDLVAATLGVGRITLAGIGRELAASRESSAKHAIKRAWRFCANERVEPATVMLAVMTRLWRRRLKWHQRLADRRPLLISLDWTKVRSLHVLMAAVVVEGRALPLCWASYRSLTLHKSQNVLEEAMLLQIKAALPAGLRIVILADRGFGRAALLATCQRLQLEYLIRIDSDVIVGTERWSGNLKHYPVQRGIAQYWQGVSYRSDGLVRTHLVIRWKQGLGGKKDQPWYLATSLGRSDFGAATGRLAVRISDLYALRFDIEELFRDAKNEHLGWSLGKTRMHRPGRLDRLMLVLALAYVLLVGLGLWCRQHLKPRLWASNNRGRELSAFAVGRVMLLRVAAATDQLMALLLTRLATPGGKWG